MGLFDEHDETPFDRVTVVLPSGKERRLTRAEYEKLPLPDRVKAILSGSLKFFRGTTEVPMNQALRR
jgi:hypothetical protein